MALSYFLVTQPLVHDVETSDETGNLPEIHPISALVTFTPNVSEVQSAELDATVLLRPIVGRIEEGVLVSIDSTVGIQLVDETSALGTLAKPLTYACAYSKVVFDKAERSVKSFRFAAPGDGSGVNLNTVARLPI